MKLKSLTYKKILVLLAFIITITTFIAYYILSDKSTVIPKSATLVKNSNIGRGLYG
jgi:hypothetical protein